MLSCGKVIMHAVVKHKIRTAGVKYNTNVNVCVCCWHGQIVDSEVAAITIDSNVNTVHFSITGRSWAMLRKYFPELIPKVSSVAVVFCLFVHLFVY